MNLTKHVFVDSVNDGYISSLETELVNYSQLQGKQNGLHNKPVLEPEFRAYIMNYIESKVQSAFDRTQQLYLPISGMAVAQKLQSEATIKINALQSSFEDKEHAMRHLVEKKKRCTPDLQKRKLRLFVYLGTVIISIVEGFFIYEALRQAAFPKLAAFCASIGIAVAIGFGTHILAGYILKAQTRLQKIFRYSIVLIPAFIGFYVIGNLRANAYNNVVNLDTALEKGVVLSSPNVSEISITIISFLLFLITLVFSIRFHKTDAESLQDQEYDRVCIEIRKLNREMNDIKLSILKIQSETSQEVATALNVFEYALSAEKRLQSIANHALELYKESNLRHRTDGLCPVFFSYSPKFSFTLFFDNIKSTK